MKIKIKKQNGCPHCPPTEEWPEPGRYDPNCICNKPMMLYIPPGQHIHCPSHPDVIIRGSDITCSTFEPLVGGCTFAHDPGKDLTFDSTKPWDSTTGDNIRNGFKVIC